MHDTGLGISVERMVDGSVLVQCDAPTVEIPPAAWAQVLAAVCARGESLDRVGEALQFHQRRE